MLAQKIENLLKWFSKKLQNTDKFLAGSYNNYVNDLLRALHSQFQVKSLNEEDPSHLQDFISFNNNLYNSTTNFNSIYVCTVYKLNLQLLPSYEQWIIDATRRMEFTLSEQGKRLISNYIDTMINETYSPNTEDFIQLKLYLDKFMIPIFHRWQNNDTGENSIDITRFNALLEHHGISYKRQTYKYYAEISDKLNHYIVLKNDKILLELLEFAKSTTDKCERLDKSKLAPKPQDIKPKFKGVTQVNSAEFNEIVLNKEKKHDKKFILVDFFAEWCGPCKKFAPTLEDFSKTYDKLLYLKVDIEKSKDLASRYGITSLPTFLVFETGILKPHPNHKPIMGANKKAVEDLLKNLNEEVTTAMLNAKKSTRQ